MVLRNSHHTTLSIFRLCRSGTELREKWRFVCTGQRATMPKKFHQCCQITVGSLFHPYILADCYQHNKLNTKTTFIIAIQLFTKACCFFSIRTYNICNEFCTSKVNALFCLYHCASNLAKDCNLHKSSCTDEALKTRHLALTFYGLAHE